MDVSKLREIWGVIVNSSVDEWNGRYRPDWVVELESTIARQNCSDCTAEQACLWAYLCYGLNAHPGKGIYPNMFTCALGHPAWQLFGHSVLAKIRRKFLWDKFRIQFVFYSSGHRSRHGWRLQEGWQEKLEFLRAVYLDGRDWYAVPMPWLEGKPRPDDVVLGGGQIQPGSCDAVLGGQLR